VKERKVGKIKNISFNDNTDDMEITLIITDNKFKKKILRDFSLMGKLKFEGDKVVYVTNIKE
jgi:sporulation protein YlmC with PRC-barrel domain